MLPILIYAIPFFVLLLVVEYVSFVHAGEDAVIGLVGYEPRDTRTSLTMGLGRVIVDLLLKVAIVAGYAGLYELSPLRLHPSAWWFWPLLFIADDFSYYWYHRIHHVCRVFWATHVVHHSSQHYNLSTALRQPWISISTFPFWMWMPLVGFPVWTVLLAQSWNLIYQFWIHTERIGHLPRWYEAVFNTPSHHRVHHGAQQQYLDRNYAGELIIWDRLFGTFEPEGERVRYGLTKNINTFNPVRVNFHEYVAIWHDLRLARGWRNRLGVLFRGPGWRPSAPARAPPAPRSTDLVGRPAPRSSRLTRRRRRRRIGPNDNRVGDGNDLIHRQIRAARVLPDRLRTGRLIDADGAHGAAALVEHVAPDPADVIGHVLVPDLGRPRGGLLKLGPGAPTAPTQNRVQLHSRSLLCVAASARDRSPLRFDPLRATLPLPPGQIQTPAELAGSAACATQMGRATSPVTFSI